MTDHANDLSSAAASPELEQALIRERIAYLYKNTDFPLTLFRNLSAYAIVAADFDGNVIAFNEGGRLAFGYPPEEVIGRQRIDLFFPGEFIEAGKLQEAVSTVISTGQFSYEGEMLRSGGERFPVHAILTLTKDMEGKMVGLILIAEDITERRLAQEKIQKLSAELEQRVIARTAQLEAANQTLTESERRFRAILETAMDGILMVDAQSKQFIMGNRAICQMLGYSLEELSALAVEDMHPPEALPEVQRYFERQLEGESRPAQDLPVKRRDGSVFFADVTASPVKIGERIYLVNVFHDVTERKLAQENTQKLNAELEQRVVERTSQLEAANQELESFSYSVSHDLRTPLRAIDGFSRILLEEYQDRLDDEGRRLLNVVGDNTRKMGQLIDDILSFSRMGRQEMALSEVDMGALARGVFDELKAAAGHPLEVKSGALPPALADPAMMRRVWTNLIDNAIKFTRPRAAAVIELGGALDGKEIVYYVKDNGVGFDMQYADKLFGVFQRLHGIGEFEGTGIGLAIVKRIVARHGGRVWAEGRVNEGATFYFALPAKEVGHD